LTQTGDGIPVQQDKYYRFALQSGPQLCVAEAPGAVYGQSLADLQAESFEDARSLRDAKRLLRAAIDVCLDGRPLKSREVMLALRHREPPREERSREGS
jgi:DNA repair protein RecO (recombination protein O)